MVLLQAYMRSERGCGHCRTCSGIDVRGGAERNTGARYWAVVNASGADDYSEPTYHFHDGNVASMPEYELSVRGGIWRVYNARVPAPHKVVASTLLFSTLNS